MKIILQVIYKDYQEGWKRVNLIQDTDDEGNPIGDSEEKMFEILTAGLVLHENVRAVIAWSAERVFTHHKTYEEDLEKWANMLGPENTELDKDINQIDIREWDKKEEKDGK